MANDPFLCGPPILVPVDPVQVHDPVKVGLKVLGPHAGETLDVAADPRAEMIDKRHLLEVYEVGGDGLVPLVYQLQVPHERIVGLLAVVHDGRALPDVPLERLVDPLGGWLAVLADDCEGPPVRVYGHHHADHVLGEPLLLGAPGSRSTCVSSRYISSIHT